MERPPLALDAEVSFPDGSTTRWDANSPQATDRPRNVTFSTARMDGFKTAGCDLARRIDRTFNDSQLFYGFALRGHDGSTAYEGQISGTPKSLGDTHTMSVQAAGLMGNAKDRKFWQIFVDRDFSQWQTPSLARRALLATGSFPTGKITAAASGDGLVWEIPNEALPDEEIAELFYEAPEGLTATSIAYQGARTGAFTGFETPTLNATTTQSFASTASTAALTLDNTLRTATLTTAARYLVLRAYLTAGPVTPAAGHQQRYTKLAVYGNHGLTTYPVTNADGTTEPDGVYASDVIRYLIATYCPLLNAGGVQDTTYPIGHLVFRDRTFPYDAMLTVNSFHRWGLECWEDGTVNYGPTDLGDYDWELRLDDFGFGLDDQGDTIEDVANAIEVSYPDALTGQRRVLTPDQFPELRDTSPINPVNRAGRYRVTDYEISQPALEGMALEIGRAALAEYNQPKAPGTATKRGYIKDRQGNEQPVWKVRAGHRVNITDYPDDRNHLVFETSYDHNAKGAQLSIDDTAPRLDAFLSRYNNGLEGGNAV